MKSFPMFIRLDGRKVIIAGGDEEAARKLRLMLKTEAEITVMAPEVDEEIADLVAAGRVTHVETVCDRDTLRDARLAFVATGCAGADASIADLARAAGATVNVVDRPDLCDATTPSIVDRDPLVVAIGTEGAAPVMARKVKASVETLLEPRLGDLVGLVGRMRKAIAQNVAPAKRRAFHRWIFDGPVRAVHRSGGESEAARLLKAQIARGEAETRTGFVSLVGAGAGAADLITLRGMQRLQEADVILYDRLVDPQVLEYARRDADRIEVGKTPGAPSWSQDRICRLIVREAAEGKRVVRLKCGDPLVFGRAAEEIEALEAANIDYEIVPGVSAAFVAAADARSLLTERETVQSLVLSTGHGVTEDGAPDWTDIAAPGTLFAFYMGVGNAARIEAQLIEAGVPRDAPTTVIERAGTPEMRAFKWQLSGMSASIRQSQVSNPAMIFVRWSKNTSEDSRLVSRSFVKIA